MLQLSNLTAQTLNPGQAVTFNKVLRDTGCAECFNAQVPNVATLRFGKATYEVLFNGNVTANAANTPVQLAIALEGFPLVETAMNAVPAAAGNLANVSAGTWVETSCPDVRRLSVINSGTNPVVLAPNSSFRIVRTA